MVLKVTTKLTEFGCGEEIKSLKNGNNIKVMIISLSKKWILRTKLIKNLLNNIGLILNKDNLLKESQSLMLNGSNEEEMFFVNLFINKISMN